MPLSFLIDRKLVTDQVRALVERSGEIPVYLAADDVINGDEDELYGDSGYLNVEEHISEKKQKEGRKYNINRRRGAKKKLEPNDALVFEIEEFAKSTVRSKVEHVFGVVKRLFRFRRTRYRGLRKQQAKFNMIFALANLYLADKKNLLA